MYFKPSTSSVLFVEAVSDADPFKNDKINKRTQNRNIIEHAVRRILKFLLLGNYIINK